MIDLLQVTQVTPGQSGTTLSQTITAAAVWNRTFNWTISKTSDTEILNLFRGDIGTVQYTVSVTNDAAVDLVTIQGQVCITNGGAVATVGLTSVLEVRSPANGAIIASQSLDVSANPVLQPGQTFCYPYTITLNNFTPNQSFKVTANTTITNHSGHLNTPFGPSTSASGTFPTSPTIINQTITVTDTNLPGQSFTFNAVDGGGTQSVNYPKTFNCSNEGSNVNTAKITQTNQTASATVTVKCYDLAVTKTVDTAFTRTYNWTITKVAVDPVTNAPISSLNLGLNQQFTVKYIITVTPTFTDSNFVVSGVITVQNPNPVQTANITITDLISTTNGNITVTPSPNTASIPPNGSATFIYSQNFNTLVTGINTATAILQNNTGLTTSFSSVPVPFDFSNAKMTEINPCVNVIDSYKGQLNTNPICRMQKTFTYDRIIGPYSICNNTVTSIDNTATYYATTASGSASWSIDVTVSCGGCTLTIGYWKTHAGFGPQPNKVGPIIAKLGGQINLGTPGGLKTAYVTNETQVVEILNFMGWDSTSTPPGPTPVSDASNGINKLYAQLLAAKLNAGNGASTIAIDSTISAADNFLATHDTTDWASLSPEEQAYVIGLASELEAYNSGAIGPGHCTEQ